MYRYMLGFLIKNDFYPITGNGHDSTAMSIIRELGWLNAYHKYDRPDPKDFLIFKKGAIQLGCSGKSEVIYERNWTDSEKIRLTYVPSNCLLSTM